MGNLLLGWPNYFTFGSISSSAEEPGLPDDNLANDQGGADQGWQCPTPTGWVQLDMGSTVAWRMFSVHRTNLTAEALIRVRVWPTIDTGSTPSYDSTLLPAGVQPGYNQSLIISPIDLGGRIARIDIQDPGNPDGFLNIPQAYAGPAWQPAHNMDYNSSVGRTSQSTKTVTRSGGTVIRNEWTKRTHSLSLWGVKRSETWSALMDLDLYARRGNNVLYVPNPDSTTLMKEALFGELEPEGNVTFPSRNPDIRAYRATITERL